MEHYKGYDIVYKESWNRWDAYKVEDGKRDSDRSYQGEQLANVKESIDRHIKTLKKKKFERIPILYEDNLTPATITSIRKVTSKGKAKEVRVTFPKDEKWHGSSWTDYSLYESYSGQFKEEHDLYIDNEDNRKRKAEIEEYKAKIEAVRKELERVNIGSLIEDQEG